MKKIYLLLLLLLLLLNLLCLAQEKRLDIEIYRNSIRTFSFTIKNQDVSAAKLYFVVKKERVDSLPRLIFRRNLLAGGDDEQILATYSSPNTTVEVFVRRIDNWDLAPGIYQYDLISVDDADSNIVTALYTGTFKIKENVMNAWDGTNLPDSGRTWFVLSEGENQNDFAVYDSIKGYWVAVSKDSMFKLIGISEPLESPDQEPGFLTGRNSDNTTDWISVDSTKNLLGIDSLFAKTGHVVPVNIFGALGDSTNQTTAIDNAMNYLHNIGGGKLVFPKGNYVYTGKVLTIPHDSAIVGNEPYILNSIIWEGEGAFTTGRSTDANPINGSVLILPYNNTNGYKILSEGKGTWECYGMTFYNPGTDSNEFIRATNTTLWFHNNSFWGSKSGTDANQDVFHLGGSYTGAPQRGDSTGFQGYGTVITENYFNKIRRGLYAYTFANGIIFSNNTFWNRCGSNDAAKSAIQFEGNLTNPVPNSTVGGVIQNNLIEVANYPYAIRIKNCSGFTISSNNMYDPSSTTLAYYYLDTGAVYNILHIGYQSGTKTSYAEIETDKNIILTPAQNLYSKIPLLWITTGLKLNAGNSATIPFWLNSNDETQYFYNQMTWGTQPNWSVRYLDTTGAASEILMVLTRASANNHYLSIYGSDVRIISETASSNFRLQEGSGGTFWLGRQNKFYILDNDFYTVDGYHQFGNSTSPGGVSNKANIYGVDESGTTQFRAVNESGQESRLTGKPLFQGMVSDSTQCSTGELYFDSTTGVIKRKF